MPHNPLRREKDKRYRDSHKSQICDYQREYRHKNKERCSRIKKKYYDNHIDEMRKILRFKNKFIKLLSAPRIGVCNLCRAVVGFDCKQTHMHHEKYDANSPLKYTIEICVRCHNKQRINA